MKLFIKRTLFLATSLVVLSSCAKEEFSAKKAKQETSNSEALEYSATLCAQSTLIRPKVDILMLWDNSSSFNFVTPATKAAMSNLITSVSEKFDYHILSAPLVPAGASSTSGSLYEAQLVVKDNVGLSGNALPIVRTKESAVASLAFSPGPGSTEAGVSRTIAMLRDNRANGIFRNGAYTIIVVISNEDEKMCTTCNSQTADNNYINPKIAELLSIRGHVNQPNDGLLNSAMMRFINISRLTSCSNIGGSVNYMYRKTAKDIYNATYANGWPQANDHLSPALPGYPDSYNLCNINFSNIFDGVNTAIKETLIKHKYDHWPLAGAAQAVDPDSVRVYQSGTVELLNRKFSNTNDGFEVLVDANDNAQNFVGKNTRYYPTAGEPFDGKLIKLYNNDRVTFPDCLIVKYTEPKATFGYIYLQYGKPNLATMQVKIDGVDVPQSSTDGWDYMGLQYVNALDPDLKIANMSPTLSSGYFLRLNGSFMKRNNVKHTFTVYYTSSN